MPDMKLGMIYIQPKINLGKVFTVSVPVGAVLLKYNQTANAFMGYYDETKEQNESIRFVWLPVVVNPENEISFHLSDDERLKEVMEIDGRILYKIVPRSGCGCV